ncbi:hypothetical protein CY0110_15932 [Crocosphaera chwakensis CCY0110]|uniref:Uncharacterized protein n=1 Tax=Crocosphaera chwakensis CCY0110 TaxID=391612 RepID=A3IHL8_9CHRO|nr:hypothetical protein CY0110_15932 [Crocosphaera chwakensis CCY0110]
MGISRAEGKSTSGTNRTQLIL